jgi:hypothetical protein
MNHLASSFTRRRDDKTEVKGPIINDTEELKEESLTRLKVIHTKPDYNKVKDGEFSHYPEIPQKTFDKLIARGITSLFPIQ